MLHAQYITGFVDGEGTFHVAIYKDPHMKFGIKVIPEFHISQRITSKHVLEKICSHFKCGYLKANHAKNPKDVTWVYVVRNKDDLLAQIIPFFQRYPLLTEKSKAFVQFAKIVHMMASKKHHSKQGLRAIVNIAYAMNRSGAYRRKKLEI